MTATRGSRNVGHHYTQRYLLQVMVTTISGWSSGL
jgi:hypothetical protein